MAKKYIKGKAAPLKKNQVRVKSGDSLWRLAEKYTGSGLNWKQLNGGKENGGFGKNNSKWNV